MTADSRAPDSRAVESLMAFWADAGVEVAYADAPIDRTVQVANLIRPKTTPGAPARGGPSAPVSAGRGEW